LHLYAHFALPERQGFNVSQSQFASFIGVSLGTLQNWEQGRRHPTGAARVLIAMAMRHPQIFAEELRDEARAFA